MSPGRYSEYHCPKSPRRRDWFEHDTRSSSWQSRSSRQTHDFTESHHSRGGQGRGRGQSKGPFDGKPIKTPEEMRKLQTLPNTRVSYFVHGGKSENAKQFQTFDEASRVAQNSGRRVSARVLHIPKGSTNEEPRTADLIDLTSDLTRETTNTEKKPKVVGPTKERPISNRKPILKPEHVPKKAKTPLRLPIWKYDLETWKNFFTVEENKDLTRAFVHPDMPAADITNFFADIREFGFVVIHTDSNCKNTLSLCSPSGIVLIFHDDQPLKLRTQVMSILYTEHDVIMYKEEAVLFSRDYKLPKPEVHELYSYYKTIFTDVKSGPAKYLRSQLGQECPLTFFDPYDRRCVQFMTLGARAIAYGLWTIAAQLAERSGLGKGANISHFMRFALLTTNGFEPEILLEDPYYVPWREMTLTSLDVLGERKKLLSNIMKRDIRRFKPRFETSPFETDSKEKVSGCRNCGHTSSGADEKHECGVIPFSHCKYPLCDERESHTELTCKYIKAWCKSCQRRGHMTSKHGDLKMPRPYLWTLYLHYQRLNFYTNFVFFGRKCGNSFFHQYTFYGLSPSLLPKSAPETGVGLDKSKLKIKLGSSDDGLFRKPGVKTRPTVGKSLISIEQLRVACKNAPKYFSGEIAGTSGFLNKDPVYSELFHLIKTVIVPTNVLKLESVQTDQARDDTTGETTVIQTQINQLAASVENIGRDSVGQKEEVPDEHLLNNDDDEMTEENR